MSKKTKIKELTWDDISIGVFQKMETIKMSQVSKVERYIELVGLLYDIENPRDLTMEEYSAYVFAMRALSELPPIAKEVVLVREINGVRFNLITDAKVMTGGKFIDFMVISKRNNIPDTLAVLYEHETMSHSDRSKWISEHETVAGAWPYLSFFLHFTKQSLEHIHRFSNRRKTRRRPNLPNSK